jgi:probable HAF family extracellular repeat protein
MGFKLEVRALLVAVLVLGCSGVDLDEAVAGAGGASDEEAIGELSQPLDASCWLTIHDLTAQYDATAGGQIYASAYGGCLDGSPLEYRATAKDSKSKSLTLSNWNFYLEPYQLPAGSAEGTYTVTIAARRANTTETVASVVRKLIVGRACDYAFLQVAPQGAAPGETVNLTPQINCPYGIVPEWRVTVSKPGGGSYSLPWLRESSTTWDTTGLNAGTATLTLAVRTFGNTVSDLSVKQKYVLGPVCTVGTLGASGSGAARTLTATSSCVGGGTPVYRFSSVAPDGSVSLLRDFDANGAFAWDVAGLNGTFTARVDVRAAESPTQLPSSKSVKVSVGDACTKLTLASLWGTHLITQPLLATATANCSQAELKFQRRSATSSVWNTVCDYSPATSCDLALESQGVGDYVVRALVRKQGSIAAYDAVSASTDFIATDGRPLLRPLVAPGSSWSTVSSVSADGRWLAGSGLGLVRWSRINGFTNLGTLPTAPPNVTNSQQTTGISDNGAVVVGWSSGQYASEPFRWVSGKMTSLIPGSVYSQIAAGTSSNGAVVVGGLGSSLGAEAFRWTSAGVVGLGDLPGGRLNSGANDVSADGNVVVGRGETAEGFRAFRWTAATGMVSLGTAPGHTTSDARSVSANGTVAVGTGAFPGGQQAIRWTAATGMVGLGDVPGGTAISFATGVSADGSRVVGAAGTGANEQEAFLWTPATGMRCIRDVLEEQGVDVSDWQIYFASDISADGKTIVGSAWLSGQGEVGWILTLP